MPDLSQRPKGASRARRSAPAWLRLATVCVVLIVVPVALYLFLYRQSRIEDATIRNFRALDTAADRVGEVLQRLSSVVNGSSFGMSTAMLDAVTERLTGQRTACGPDGGAEPRPWQKPRDSSSDPLRSRHLTPTQRLQYRYWLAAHVLSESNGRDHGATRKLWDQLHCLVDTHRRHSRPNESIEVQVSASPRISLLPTADSDCSDGTAGGDCERRRELMTAATCKESAPSPQLSAAREGMAATIVDCRRLRERYPDLYHALERFHGSDAVIQAIDLFAIQSTAQLDGLMEQATGYLSRFFDSHLIADADGRILFDEDTSLTAGAETDERQVATPAFSSHVDISELLRAEYLRSAGAGGTGENRGDAASATAFPGRSFVQTVSVENVVLRAFVHPFVLDSIDARDDAGQASDEGVASATEAGRPTFYLVGIVDDREFASAAIRLRLALVVDGTLVLLVLLTLTPLLWLWTAGDRLAVRRPALTVVCAAPVVGLVLLTVLACGMVTNRIDEHVLDGALEHVSDRIAGLFDQEMSNAIHDLRRAVPRLLARAASERPRRPPGEKMRLQKNSDLDGETLTGLEKEFYCDDADRRVAHDPPRPEAEGPFLLGDDGRQRACLGRSRLSRTPRLDLAFRGYFRHPRQGALWRPAPSESTRSVRCRVRDVQDKESRIPCIVDNLGEPWKRPVVSLSHASSFRTRGGEAPYFVERIDSVVGGQVGTILAIQTGSDETPVAAATAPLNSLDRAVPPQHVDFAVVDRETGRTLFHSDDDLAMTTNFAEDAGGDPALWSLLRSRATDTIGLVYAGIPIRAHVRPLRPGMPWTLIVYRGHELEDRLTTVTTTLSIFYTLLGLIVLGVVVGLLLFVVHWRAPGMFEGLPVTLGRAMATGARFLGPFAVLVGVVPLVLLSGPFLAPGLGPPSNPWVPWNPWGADGGWNPWPLFPLFAVASVVAAVSFLACCALGMRRPANDTNDTGHGAGTLRRVLTLALVLAGLAVVPAWLSFGYHRAALGAGLDHYLVDRTLESVDRAREKYRIDRFTGHGVAVAPAGDRTRYRVHDERRMEEGWVSRAVRPLLASSRLSNELLIYRNLPRPAADDVASLYGAFDATFGYRVTWPLWQPGGWPLWLLSASLLLLIVALLGATAYSLCAVCTIVRGRGGGVVALPDAERLLVSDQGSVHAIVLCRSERDRRCLVRRLNGRFSPYRHHVHTRGRGQPRIVHWIPEEPTTEEALYIFDDLRSVLQDDADGRVLFDELQRLVDGGAAVLAWSRVAPDYRYSDRFRPADRWFGARADGADRRARWAGLARKFRSCVLHCSGRHGECFDQGVKKSSASGSAMREVENAMKVEAIANPDLMHLAVDVVDDVRRFTTNAPSARDARAFAVTAFRKGAASHFNQIWAESTQDERLQLYALASRGVVDSRRSAVLSSLVNRGLVEPDPDSNVIRLRSEAFGEFITHDVDHGELHAWRKEGEGGAWRFIWPPLAIGAVLGLVFLAMANPEMRGPMLTALLGLAPAALPALRGGQGGGMPQS